ncbi:MAG: hypothetical protein U5K84_04115 [Alkalibacterium sp.]|nr:hypothetical protein [Alkalibacterium sp.]
MKLVPADEVTPWTRLGQRINGAFAVAWSNGLTIEESIRLGNLAASLAIGKMGWDSVPTLEEMKGNDMYEKMEY